MKLELNSLSASQQLEKGTTERASSPSTTVTSPASSKSDDRTTLQSGAQTIQSLVNQALSTPDVRQNKVDAIKQSISSGNFKFDAGKVADAMIADSKQSKP